MIINITRMNRTVYKKIEALDLDHECSESLTITFSDGERLVIKVKGYMSLWISDACNMCNELLGKYFVSVIDDDDEWGLEVISGKSYTRIGISHSVYDDGDSRKIFVIELNDGDRSSLVTLKKK